MPEVFSAQTARIREATNNIAQYVAAAQAIVDNFRTGIAPTRPWPGLDDAFAQQTRPGEIEETDTANRTGTSLAGAVAGVQRGVSMTLDALVGTQTNALDAINEHANRRRPPRI
ncbi:hypothetical protein [Streptomyces sp. HC307]|uniref:hypothetical protein n=1 Tax=Streptomyces flavusporus TaxID=3385496 RepID=UPI003917183C